MARSGKAALSVLAACALTPLGLGVTGLAIADSFDFEGIEVQEQFGEAIVTLDAPPGGNVEHAVDADTGEMTVTFRGTSIRLPRRVYSGEGTLKSVDLEPWFADGERLTRMVVKYEVGSDAWLDQEGDVIMLSVADPDAEVDQAEEMADAASAMAAEAMTVSASRIDQDAAPDAVDAADAAGQDAFTGDESALEFVSVAAVAARAQDTAPVVPVDTTPASGDPTPVAAPDTPPSVTEEPAAELVAEAIVADPVTETVAASSDWTMWGEPEAVSDDGMPASGPATVTETTLADMVGASAREIAPESTPPASGPEEEDEEIVYASATRQAGPTEAGPAPAEPATDIADADAVATDIADAFADAPSGDVTEVEDTFELPNESYTFATGTQSPTDAQPVVPVDMEADPKISIDLQGAEIHTVLRSISESSGHDIVANSGVQGTVTLRLNDVPWRRALQIILRTQGLDYVEELGVIRVAKADVLRAEEIERESAYRKKDGLVPLATQLVPVQFATASELVGSVTGMLSPRGKLEVDERTNTIIVTDIPHVLPAVDGLVRQLDSRTPQVEIVAELVDMDAAVARELGIQWGAENLHSTSEALSGNAAVDAGIARSVGTINFGVIRDWVDLNLTLQALEQTNKANIISNPRISTVNNREARILVGQEIPLVVQDEAGNAITELKKIGIELRVTPYINQGNMITLDLHPQVSDLASQSSDASGIIINTSEADTRVMVRDGETVAIGGMIRQNETETERRVPVLGSLPILGAIFRSTSTTESKRELIIFVTPRIVD